MHTAARQVNIQLMGSNRLILFQLSLFRVILVLIAGLIIGLIVYTFTLDKTREIAVLKLLGVPGRRIYGMILSQAMLMGGLGTLLGGALELAIEGYFRDSRGDLWRHRADARRDDGHRDTGQSPGGATGDESGCQQRAGSVMKESRFDSPGSAPSTRCDFAKGGD